MGLKNRTTDWKSNSQVEKPKLVPRATCISSMVLVNQSLNFRIRHYRNENETAAEMGLAIVTRYASVSYWLMFSLSLTTVPEVFANIISAIKDLINRKNEDVDEDPASCKRWISAQFFSSFLQ